MMKGSEFLLRARQNGSRPGFSSVVVGLVGLVGGAIGAGIGSWIALNVIGSMWSQGPEGLSETFERMLMALAVLALGVAVGLLVGSVAMSALTMSLLGWEEKLLTVSLIVLVNLAVIPLSLALVVFADTSEIAMPLALLLAAVAVGGLVPGLARWLATRTPTHPTRHNQHPFPTLLP